MHILLSLILFIPVIFFVIYIPGRVVVEYLKIKYEFNTHVLCIVVGLCLYLLSIYLLSFIHLQHMYYGVIAISVIIFFRNKYFRTLNLNSPDNILPAIIITVGSVFFVSFTFFSGIVGSEGMVFYGINIEDGVIHVARIKNMLFNFPPVHPGLAGIEFRGYHYFYDLLLASFVRLFFFSPEDLYYRNFSIFVALLYGITVYQFVKTRYSKLATIFILLFAYFSVGFASLIPPKSPVFSSNFAHPMMLIVDPSVLLSVALLFTAFALLPSIHQSRKNILLPALILGILCQLKVYSGLIGIAVLVLYSLYLVIKNKNNFISVLLMNFVVAVITAITFLPNNLGAGGLVLHPFLFYSHFIKQGYFDSLQWETRRSIFAEHNNFPRIILQYVQAVSIFWILTLGTRLVFVYKLFALFKRSFWKIDHNAIVLFAISIPVALASVFVQSISVFDIGQFFWIAVILLSIPAGYSLAQIWEKQRVLGVLILIIFAVTSLLEIKGYGEYYLGSKSVVSYNDLQVYSAVSRHVPTNESVVLVPIRKKEFIEYPPLLTSAMTGRSIYYEHEKIEYPLETLYTNRKNDINTLHEALQECDLTEVESVLKKIGTRNIVSYTQYPCLDNQDLIKVHEKSVNLNFYVHP